MPVKLTDDELHWWLTLHAKQLRARIVRLRAEQRSRRGLPPRPFALLLNSIDELRSTERELAEVSARMAREVSNVD